ncbi:MAG: gluconate 2-dehydrogenase subunit 3 family protein [bacterium]
MKRRDFIKASGSAALLCTSVHLGACEKKETPPPQQVQQPPPEWKFFVDPREREVANVALFRMLPADPESGAPSAHDLDVLRFVDEQLALPHFRDLHRMMHGGFDFLDRVSTKRFGGTFVSRTPEDQDKILAQFQMGLVNGLKFPQARFFETLRTFALEGYWGAPKYGGNKDKGAWSWVGINPHCSHIHGTCSE